MSRINHQTAQALITEGEAIVSRIRGGRISQNQKDDLGKKAMGVWAQAQVYATLAVADAILEAKA